MTSSSEAVGHGGLETPIPSTFAILESTSTLTNRKPEERHHHHPPSPTRSPSSSSRRTRSPTATTKKEGTGNDIRLDNHDFTIDKDVRKRLNRYLLGFAVVEFDLDKGPTLTTFQPTPLPTTMTRPDLLQNIAFSSLPENEDQLPTAGAHIFSFRIPIDLSTSNRRENQPSASASTTKGSISASTKGSTSASTLATSSTLTSKLDSNSSSAMNSIRNSGFRRNEVRTSTDSRMTNRENELGVGGSLSSFVSTSTSTSTSSTDDSVLVASSFDDGEVRIQDAESISKQEEDQEEKDGLEGEEPDGYLHGYVYFLQERNSSIRRGYSQRSLVLLSHRPGLIGLFSSTISTLGALHFKHDRNGDAGMLETACYNIANWPDLIPGATLDFPFLGVVYSISIPLGSQPQWSKPPASSSKVNIRFRHTSPSVGGAVPIIPISVPLTPLSTSLHSTLSFSKILLLWELILLGDPVLIFSSDPRTGSELVHHLRNLIRPIVARGEWRPYFHIHERDAGKVVNPVQPLEGSIISITNPLILSQCKSWPHILRTHIGKTETNTTATIGLTSTKKRHIKKDSIVAKAVDDAFKTGDYVTCDMLIFRHLATLTEQFLAPLNRYFGTLPTPSSTSTHSSSFASTAPTAHPTSTPLRPSYQTHTKQPSFLSPPPTSAYPTFTPSHFLTSLRSHGTPLPFRSSSPTSSLQSTIERFYSRFLVSPNFESWLNERTSRTEQVVRDRWLVRIEGADLGGWARGRTEDEVERLVRRLEDEATISEKQEKQRSLSSSPTKIRNPTWSSPQTPTDPSSAFSPNKNTNTNTSSRSVKLRTQVAKLKSLRNESKTRGLGFSETLTAGSDSDRASVRSSGN